MRSIVLVALAATSGACNAQGARTAERINEIVVTGEQPGPKLWKLTKHGHTLWILPTVNPKPRDIIWKSTQVAGVLDRTQEVFDQTNILDFDVKSPNPFARLSALRKALKIREESRKRLSVRDAVPPEDYARFTKLKADYLPKDKDLDLAQPLTAGQRLYNAAMDAKGLTMESQIHNEVHRLARKRGIKVSEVRTEIKLDVDKFIQIQVENGQPPKGGELACFRETLDLIENKLPDLTSRANAWAKGDEERLRALRSVRRDSCSRAEGNAPLWNDIEKELDSRWLETMESAVKRNESTLAMLDIAEFIEPNGLVEMLGQRGFEIEEPK